MNNPNFVPKYIPCQCCTVPTHEEDLDEAGTCEGCIPLVEAVLDFIRDKDDATYDAGMNVLAGTADKIRTFLVENGVTL